MHHLIAIFLSGRQKMGTHPSLACLQLFLLFLVHAYSGRVKEAKPLKMVMDGPWHWMWPCLLPWVAFQTAISLGWLHNAATSKSLDTY